MPWPKKGERTPGSGKKKGHKQPQTIEKEAERERIRQVVTAELAPMLQAQIAHAKGVSYMILRQPDGTYARATDVQQIDAACAVGASAFRIFTQAPNVQAFAYLLDRAYDKPVQPHELTGATQGPIELIIRAPWDLPKP